MKTATKSAQKSESTNGKKYTKVGNAPSGEWLVKDNATGEEKKASDFGDVTLENTDL